MENKTDKISVIVPVYNVENYLDRCINSIVKQTYKNLEIILVDDGSTDSSYKICNEWAKKDERIKVLHNKNEGVSKARNVGIDASTGDFIAFVDSDDYIEETMFEKLLDKQKTNNSDIVFCRVNQIYNNKTKRIYEYKLKDLCLNRDITYFVYQENQVKKHNTYYNKNAVWACIWRCLYKKKIVMANKFNENLCMGEDACFIINLIFNNKLKLDYIDDHLYNYVIRPGSLSRENISYKEQIEKIITNTNQFIKLIFDILKNYLKRDEILNAYQFSAYLNCFLLCLNLKEQKLLQNIKKWKTKKGYKACLKYTKGLTNKILIYCAYKNITWPLYIAKKIKRKIKGKN